MFILLFLYLCKKSWQFFVLLLFFLYELFYYYLIVYLGIYVTNKIINAILFGLYFLYNIFSIYLNFYFYLCLYYFIANVDLFKKNIYVIIEQRNIFILFFVLLCCFFLFKLIIYLCFYLIKNILILTYFHGLKFYKLCFTKNTSFFYFWKSLTNFLRAKHYKASIFFLYVFYIIIITNLLFMNFNPVL